MATADYPVKDGTGATIIPTGRGTGPRSAGTDVANIFTLKQTFGPLANDNAIVGRNTLDGANTQSVLDLAATWNTSGTPSALKLNVTDTASNAASLFMDLQINGVSKVSIGKNGNIASVGGNISTSGHFQATNNASEIRVGSNSDIVLARDAADSFAQRRTTNAQLLAIYNTYGSAANNEWFGLDWKTTPNVARLRMVANGTGVLRPIAIDAFQKAGAAVAADIPSGTAAIVRDTVGTTTKLVYNNAGTLMSVALA